MENEEEMVEHLHFLYDAQSKPAFVEYNGEMHRYVYNLQGDIIGIVDANGTLVVEYNYDAWGKPTFATGVLASTLGILNPFRYRGYTWDEETDFYYLSTRYYNIQIARLVNSDSVIPEVFSFNGLNIFVYCSNCVIIEQNCVVLVREVLRAGFGKDLPKSLNNVWTPTGLKRKLDRLSEKRYFIYARNECMK